MHPLETVRRRWNNAPAVEAGGCYGTQYRKHSGNIIARVRREHRDVAVPMKWCGLDSQRS